MDKSVKWEPRKPYSKPTLTVYGTVRELTKSVGQHGPRDNGTHPPAIKSHL
jgi:hypothetical protein